MLRRLLFISMVVVLFACGGGGGPSSGGICSATLYTPNYAAAPNLNLRKWNHLPIKVYFQTNTPIGATTIEQLARDGFNLWETALGRDMWTEVLGPGGADLTVEIRPSAPQSTLATTTVFFNTSNPVILTSATMVIFTWGAIPQGDYAPTAAHEMGHALGIGGHSPTNTDIMYFTGNASGLLTTPDINTIRTAYCDFATTPLTAPTRSREKGPQGSETFVYPAK